MIWKTCARFPSYSVSEDGQVKRIKPGIRGGEVGKLMKPYRRADGYNMFILREANRSHHVKSHQLVAEAFVGPKPFATAEVRHRDGTRSNNHWRNLRWGTRAENVADQAVHGTDKAGERHHASKLSAEQINEIRRRYAAGGILQRELAAEFGVLQGHVSRIVSAKRWSR